MYNGTTLYIHLYDNIDEVPYNIQMSYLTRFRWIKLTQCDKKVYTFPMKGGIIRKIPLSSGVAPQKVVTIEGSQGAIWFLATVYENFKKAETISQEYGSNIGSYMC